MRPSSRAGFRSDPDGAAMTAITAASESCRSGDAKCSIDRTAPAQNTAAAVPPRRSGASYIPQLCARRFTRPRQTRLDGANRNAEGEPDLLVAQAVDLAQHDCRALIEWQTVERCPNPLRQ